MRARELKPDPLIHAIEAWLEMEHDEDDVETILRDPRSRPFRRPPGGIQYLYRCLVTDGALESEPAYEECVTYSITVDGALAFYDSLNTDEDFVIVRKQFRPADFVLDFTALRNHVMPTDPDNPRISISEREIWMRNNAYYGRYKKSEIVYTSEDGP